MMLQRLTKVLGCRAVIFMAALYAFTALAPHGVMAFGKPNGTAHCLTASNTHDHETAAHHHSDEPDHVHATGNAEKLGKNADDSDGSPPVCCGLFSVLGIPAESYALMPTDMKPLAMSTPLPDRLDGQGPARINRPPIA